MHKNYGLNELREMFLKFFETKEHLRLPSFSLIPQNDASLLLINSGMAPMKPWFTGEEEPPRHRVCTCQKCIRTGDIENIGKTARHGTYFEMLGNFSFGDYFKRDAIHWAWEFLTSPEWVGLEPDRLYPSVFAGNETTPADDEAFAIWRDEIGIPEDRIFKFGKEDNFWEHGSGPCGPCSEIYYDRGPEWGCGKPGCTVGCDCDRYIEVWNVVFSQFDNDGEGHYTELKQKNIDTGMGLERLACVSQNVASLFDVDTVMNITNKVSEITGAKYEQSDKIDVSLRVITDHIRSATFMICDGVLPSNEGRGYVLRRLLRRAARHGKLLGVNHPFLYEVCDTVVHENEGHYPELRERQAYITKVIRTEEENFAKTLDAGMKIYDDMLSAHKAQGETVFSGADAFKLYDTYGFPIDLTVEMAEEAGMTVDQEGFKALMEEQKVRARKAREALGDLGWAGIEFGKDMPATEFVGYDRSSEQGRVLALVADGELRDELAQGVEGILVLDQTPFYAEMGGQVADHGYLTSGTANLKVNQVKKTPKGFYVHTCTLLDGTIRVGDTVTAAVDEQRRASICRNHTATHLMQKALREVLGEHVHQAGSYQDDKITRFDFTHFNAVTPEELVEVEKRVNEKIFAALPVTIQNLPIEEAKKMGAMALFGAKYGKVVRVVDAGGWSVEFCGGTHVKNTAQIGCFKILSEASVAAGIRRIEATTGYGVLNLLDDRTAELANTAVALKANNMKDVAARAQAVTAELKEANKQLEIAKAKLASSQIDGLFQNAVEVDGVRIVTVYLNGTTPDTLRSMMDKLRDKEPNAVGALIGTDGSKTTLAVGVGKNALARGLKAGALVKQIAAIAGGNGGGKPDFAMAGIRDTSKIDDALNAVEGIVKENLEKAN